MNVRKEEVRTAAGEVGADGGLLVDGCIAGFVWSTMNIRVNTVFTNGI